MTAGVAGPSPLLSKMAVPDVEYIVPPSGPERSESSLDQSPASPRIFKKHKVLPHPRNGSANGSANGSVLGTGESRRSSSGSQSLHTLRHQHRKISGGDLPPTPPAHSRTSSSSHSVNLSISNLSPLQTPPQSSEDVQSKTSPSTPPNQRSPPTPEVTPPQSETRSKAFPLRPMLSHRIPSKSTTDSRTESFRTALESPEPSDEEDSRSTVRPVPPSARTSQITVRQLNGGEKKSQNGVGSGPGVQSDVVEEQHDLTPRSKGEFISFDGEWNSGGEVEQQWDDNLSRNVTVKKRRDRAPVNGQGHEVVDERTVSPTNAAKAVRAMPLQGRILTYDSLEPNRRSFTAPEAASKEAPTNYDARRSSGMSSKSAASTVVEAILVGTPPCRHRTLRHVKRVDALRNFNWQPSSTPLSSAPSSLEDGSRRRHLSQPKEAPRESYASNSTVNSISSRKARREVWKNGGIPVVVVPERQSSTRPSSQEHSLRSTSSQRSKRTHSVASASPSQVPNYHDLTPYFDRPPKRGRRTSESDGSTPGDQRTIDFPPAVPRRTSSLSAPTSRNTSREASRNGSRAGSLTTESLKAHNESVITKGVVQARSRAPAGPASHQTETSVPVVTVDSAPSEPSYAQLKIGENLGEAHDHHLRTFDTLLGSPLLSTKDTPFSQTSVETNGTAAEISQAMAVSIVPHQNRSILMVDHRPSDSSDGDPRSQGADRPERPIITTTEVSGTSEDDPVTPPQVQHPLSLTNVDSPLRNPRAPPEPPVLQFIPATPSGLTPAEERPRLLGNFYDETEPVERPPRGLAMVRRALNKRRHSYGPSPGRDARPGFLTRTLSLSRNIRKDTAENPDIEQNGHDIYDDEPRDESRLHPDWRPSNHPGFYGEDRDGADDMEDDEEEEASRYPPIVYRPRPPKRSISERMKRTFAIFPLQDHDNNYIYDGGPERRTIRRTPNERLRVVKQRGSVESLRKKKQRPATAPETRRLPLLPRSYSWTKGRRGDRDQDTESQRNGLSRTWSLTQSVQSIPRRLSEKRREKRSNELRQKISGPRDLRDGVNDVIRRDGLRQAFSQPRRAEGVARF